MPVPVASSDSRSEVIAHQIQCQRADPTKESAQTNDADVVIRGPSRYKLPGDRYQRIVPAYAGSSRKSVPPSSGRSPASA